MASELVNPTLSQIWNMTYGDKLDEIYQQENKLIDLIQNDYLGPPSIRVIDEPPEGCIFAELI